MANDIIIDTLDTLLRIVQSNGGVLLANHRTEAERIVRAAWAGERPYIAKVGESAQREISERNRAIRRDWQRGNHLTFIARRYGISLRTAQAIVQPDRTESAAVCLTDCAQTAQPTEDSRNRGKRAGHEKRRPGGS